MFTFDNDAKRWLFYDPRAAKFSELRHLVPGKPYLFLVTTSLGLNMNGAYRNLTCYSGNCWNVVVW